MSPPPSLMTSMGVPAKIRPYDGDDATMIISSVQNRPRSRSNAGGQATPAYGGAGAEGAIEVMAATPPRSTVTGSPRSVGRSLGGGHRRTPSGSNPNNLPPKPLAAALFDAANGGPSPAHHLANAVAAEAAAAAGGGDQESSSPDYSAISGIHGLTALKSLPMNPMAAPRSSGLLPSALGLDASPDMSKSSSAHGDARPAANATEVV